MNIQQLKKMIRLNRQNDSEYFADRNWDEIEPQYQREFIESQYQKNLFAIQLSNILLTKNSMKGSRKLSESNIEKEEIKTIFRHDPS